MECTTGTKTQNRLSQTSSLSLVHVCLFTLEPVEVVTSWDIFLLGLLISFEIRSHYGVLASLWLTLETRWP